MKVGRKHLWPVEVGHGTKRSRTSNLENLALLDLSMFADMNIDKSNKARFSRSAEST